MPGASLRQDPLMTEAVIVIDAASATIEKRNIAFSAMVDEDTRKFAVSI